MSLLSGPIFANCTPASPLGYPSFYRAYYRTSRLDLAAQLASVVESTYQRMRESSLALPVNHPQPVNGQLVAVLVLATAQDSASRTCAELARELDNTPFWGFWPTVLEAVVLDRLEQIDITAAYSDSATDQARDAAETNAAASDPLTKAEELVQLLVGVLVVAVIAYAAFAVYRESRR